MKTLRDLVVHHRVRKHFLYKRDKAVYEYFKAHLKNGDELKEVLGHLIIHMTQYRGY